MARLEHGRIGRRRTGRRSPPRILAQWGSLWPGPSGDDGHLSEPAGLAIGPTGDTYVLDDPLLDDATPYLHPRVVVYDPDGAFVTDFGGPADGPGQLQRRPRAIAVAPDGRVFVADDGDRVQVYAGDGSFQATWGGPGAGPVQFDGIRGLAVGAEGELYVADVGNHRVQVLDARGEHLADWTFADRTVSIGVGPDGDVYLGGRYGGIRRVSPEGVVQARWRMVRGDARDLLYASGVAVAGDGRVYVTDYFNDRVQVFDGAGAPLALWSTDPERVRSGDFPDGLAIDPNGDLVVALGGPTVVTTYSPTGVHLRSWGGPIPDPGEFADIGDVAAAPSGQVFVEDGTADRVQRFSSDGIFEVAFGGTGRDPGDLREPSGLAVGPDGLVYVADFRNRRVQVLTPDGDAVRAWSTTVVGPHRSDGPSSPAIGPDGHVFVFEGSPQRLLEFTPRGRKVADWGAVGGGESQTAVYDVAVGPHGDVYLLEAFRQRVIHLGPDHRPRSGFALVAPTSGRCCLSGLTVDRAGVLSVTTGDTLQRYTAAGQYLGEWSIGSDAGQVTVDPLGRTLVVDAANAQVTAYGPLPLADARVRAMPGGPLLGDDRVGGVAAAPAAQATTDRSGTAVVEVTAQNDGPVAEALVVRASTVGERFGVAYDLAGDDVTAAVAGAGATTVVLEPGRSARLRVAVQLGAGVVSTSRLRGRVTVSSTTDPSVEDVVRFVVRPG